MTEKLAKVLFGGPGQIQWIDHVCPDPGSLLQWASPVSSLISAGFSMVAAGASIYAVFELKKQGETLRRIEGQLRQIDRKIDVMNYKLDIIGTQVQELIGIANTIQDVVIDTHAMTLIKTMLVGTLTSFDQRLSKARSISKEDIFALHSDVLQTARGFYGTRSNADIPLPAYVINEHTPALCFFRAFNMFLVECHNRIVQDPLKVRQYLPLEGNIFVSGQFDESWRMLLEVRDSYNRTDMNKKPRFRWLFALLWEVSQTAHLFRTSELFCGEPKTIYLPTFQTAQLEAPPA